MKCNGWNKSKSLSGARRASFISGRCLSPVFRLVLLLPVIFLLASCGDSSNRADLAARMAADDGDAENDQRISELKGDIRGVEKLVEKTLDAVRDEGTYWRLLGMKYMDYQMWGKAIEAFDEAVSIYPEHSVLLYNRALSAGQMALSIDTPELKTAYFERSEAGYRRALALDPKYSPPMYALAVLLVFELNRPMEAAPLLEDFLKIERSDINGRFLLARVYLEAGRASDALNLYDEIIRTAQDKSDVTQAEDLYNRVAGGNYES